jgi:hypothetical protein
VSPAQLATTSTTPTPTRVPARRPATGEVPGMHTMATAHLAAGARDSRRILKEALAAAQHEAAQVLSGQAAFYLRAALDPAVDEDVVRALGVRMLHLEGAGVIGEGMGVAACVAMIEGWTHRQQLTAGGAR